MQMQFYVCELYTTPKMKHMHMVILGMPFCALLQLNLNLQPHEAYQDHNKEINSGKAMQELGVVYAWVCQDVGVTKYKFAFLLAFMHAIKHLIYYWICSFSCLELNAV